MPKICLLISRVLPRDARASTCEIQDYKGFSLFSKLEESNHTPQVCPLLHRQGISKALFFLKSVMLALTGH